MAVAHTRVFISHSTKNAAFVDRLVERLRDNYSATWYAPRHTCGGYFAENIHQSLNRRLRYCRMLNAARKCTTLAAKNWPTFRVLENGTGKRSPYLRPQGGGPTWPPKWAHSRPLPTIAGPSARSTQQSSVAAQVRLGSGNGTSTVIFEEM